MELSPTSTPASAGAAGKIEWRHLPTNQFSRAVALAEPICGTLDRNAPEGRIKQEGTVMAKGPSKVMLIRHGEKVGDPSKDDVGGFAKACAKLTFHPNRSNEAESIHCSRNR